MASLVPSIPVVWQVYALVAWLLGMWIFTGWLIVRLRHLRRVNLRNQDQTVLPEWFAGLLTHSAERLKLRRIPKVVLTNSVITPAVFGLFRPVLLMPADRLAKLSRQDAEHILLHELAHIKRGDLLVHGFYILLQIVYWFNPLLWLVRRQMQHLRELCCDATVARILRERTSEYRDTLLETARELLAKPVEPGLGLLGLFEDSSRLLTRLRWLEKKTWRHHRLRIAIVCTIMTLMSACVLPMAKADKEGNAIEEDRTAKNLTLANKNKSKFVATLPNGVTVELVGVCEHPSQGKQWWRPDGSYLDTPCASLNPKGLNVSKSNIAYELVTRLSGSDSLVTRILTPERWEIKDAKKVGLGVSGTVKDAEGKSLPCLRATSAIINRKIEQVDIKFGIVHNTFETKLTVKPYEKTTHKIKNYDVNVKPPYENKGNSVVTIKIPNRTDRKAVVRVVAHLKNGSITGNAALSRDGKIRFMDSTDHYEFHGLKLADVDHFVIWIGEYQWVEFKNVSLKPNFKTDMQIEVEKVDRVGQSPTLPAANVNISGSKLEFRIAVKPEYAELSKKEIAQLKNEFRTNGLKRISKEEDKFQWFEARSENDFQRFINSKYQRFITGEYQGRKYVLLYDDKPYVMLSGTGWGLQKVEAVTDPMGNPAVAFEFDKTGAALFGTLTASNLQKSLAIVIDDKVHSAPTVQAKIQGKGQISGRYSKEEVSNLINALRIGMPPIELRVNEYPSFRPVVKMVVNDGLVGIDCLIDFDTGKLMSFPAGLRLKDNPEAREIQNWMKKSGVDAGGATQKSVRGLICEDIIAVPLDNKFWDEMQAGKLVTFNVWDMYEPASPIFMTARGELPATYMFKTREGGIGILQITGFTDESHGVKIRYKMLQKEKAKSPIDFSTPEATIKSFVKAVYNGNLEAAMACVSKDGHDYDEFKEMLATESNHPFQAMIKAMDTSIPVEITSKDITEDRCKIKWYFTLGRVYYIGETKIKKGTHQKFDSYLELVGDKWLIRDI